MEQEKRDRNAFFFRPMTGHVLAVGSGLSFYLLCIMISLVGPAGSSVAHADKNRVVFTAVLLITLLLSAATVGSRLGCRKFCCGGLPWVALGLCTICILLLVVLFAGGFKI